VSERDERPIKQTDNYVLKVARSREGELCYQCVNRTYGVVEVQISDLPSALALLWKLEDGLKRANEAWNPTEAAHIDPALDDLH